jgi:hypothetical protein
LGTLWGKWWNWERFGNSLETWWEYSGNTLDKGKNEKSPHATPSPKNHCLNLLSHNPHNPDQLMTCCKVVTKLSSQLWGPFQWKGNVPPKYVITEAYWKVALRAWVYMVMGSTSK